MKPDRFFDLDLAHRDDREVCKVIQLTVWDNEPDP